MYMCILIDWLIDWLVDRFIDWLAFNNSGYITIGSLLMEETSKDCKPWTFSKYTTSFPTCSHRESNPELQPPQRWKATTHKASVITTAHLQLADRLQLTVKMIPFELLMLTDLPVVYMKVVRFIKNCVYNCASKETCHNINE